MTTMNGVSGAQCPQTAEAQPRVEVRMAPAGPARCRASVHVTLADGSFTISSIAVEERNGKVQIAMPLVRIGGQNRPGVSLQGGLKEQVHQALTAAYAELRARQSV